MKWVAPLYRLKKEIEQDLEKKREYHDWYAWHPVRVHEFNCDDIVVPTHWVWLEPVARRLVDVSGYQDKRHKWRWRYKPAGYRDPTREKSEDMVITSAMQPTVAINPTFRLDANGNIRIV